MVTERINTVSGDELMEMDLEPIGFTVEDLISEHFYMAKEFHSPLWCKNVLSIWNILFVLSVV